MSEVKDNPGTRRFEMTSGDSTAILEYPRPGDRIVLVHIAAPQALSGQGVGCKPVRGALVHKSGPAASAKPETEVWDRLPPSSG